MNGSNSTFQVRGVGAGFVDLFDGSRKLFVRLTEDQGLARTENRTEFLPWPGSAGRWVAKIPAASLPANLRGTWRDLSGQWIQMYQTGADLSANADNYPAWKSARGVVVGNTIRLTHFDANGRTTAVVTGLIQGNRIEWANKTSWIRP